MTPRQADPNYPIGGDPARYSHFKRFLEAAFPTFSSLLAAAEAFAGLPEQTTYTRTELEQALSASTDPACALVDMDLLTTNSPVTPKDAGTLPVDWQSRIPALRGFWRAVQAHPGCFALLTAMTANRAKASLLSKDGVPTLSGELNTQALLLLEDIVRTKFNGNASGTQVTNLINKPPYVFMEVPPAVAQKVNSPYGNAIRLMRAVPNFNGFHVWLEQSTQHGRPLKTPTPHFLTVRCPDRWVFDLADPKVEIPSVRKDKLARLALDYFVAYGCLPLRVLRSLLYAVGCIPPVSSSKYGPLPVYALLDRYFLSCEVPKGNAPETGRVTEDGYRHADRHTKRDPTLGGVYIKLNDTASELVKDKGVYPDNFAKTYKMPPIDSKISSYEPLKFYERYLCEGTQVLLLGDLDDEAVSKMTQKDYDERVSDIKKNLKSCQEFCPGNTEKYSKLGLPQFFPSPLEKGAGRCGACCVLEHLCLAAGASIQEIHDAFFINMNWRDKEGTYSRFSFAFSWATRCGGGCAAPTLGEDVYGATPDLACFPCISRRKRDLATYLTSVENESAVLESHGHSVDRSKLTPLPPMEFLSGGPRTMCEEPGCPRQFVMPKRIVLGHPIRTFNIGEDGQRRICTLCFRKDLDYHHDYKIKNGPEYRKILSILGKQPTLASLSAAARSVKAMPNHLLSLLEDFDLAGKYLAHDELEAFKRRLESFAQSLQEEDGNEAEELEEDSELRH